MQRYFSFVALAVVGLVSGYVSYQLSWWVRTKGPISRRVLLGHLADSLPAFPGLIAIGMFIPDQTAFTPSNFIPLFVAFGAPYAAVRLGLVMVRKVGSQRREDFLPYAHWFGLLRTDDNAARQFLDAYLASQRKSSTHSIDTRHVPITAAQHHRVLAARRQELEHARAQLTQAYSADPHLPRALSILDAHMERLSTE